MDKNTRLAFLCAMIIGMTSVQTLPIAFIQRPLAVVKRISTAPFRLGKRVLTPVVRHCATHKKLSCLYAASLAAVGAVATSFHVPWTWNKWLRVGTRFPRFGGIVRRCASLVGKDLNCALRIAGLGSRDAETVDRLCRIGVDANEQDFLGNTLLFRANDAAIARTLIHHGARVDIVNRTNFGRERQPLHCARNAEVARELLANGADINAIDGDGKQPLQTLIDWGRTDVVRLLLEQRTDEQAHALSLNALLNYAIQAGKVDIINLLLEHGADPTTLDPHIARPWLLIHLRDHQLCLRLLRGMGVTLHNTIGSEAFLNIFLEDEALDVNALDEKGFTALHYAAQHGNIDAMNKLIVRHADVNAVAGLLADRTTALFSAVLNGHPEAVRILLRNGANVNAVDRKFRTPLQYISAIRDRTLALEIANILIDEGHADFNIQGCGPRLLRFAITNGWNNLALRLIPLFGERNLLTPRSPGAPLGLAVRAGNIEIIQSLIVEYERAHITDQINYLLLLFIADRHNHIDVQRLLLDDANGRGIVIDEQSVQVAQRMIAEHMQPQMEVFVQALHPRLGAESPARVLPPDIYQWIWNAMLTGVPTE